MTRWEDNDESRILRAVSTRVSGVPEYSLALMRPQSACFQAWPRKQHTLSDWHLGKYCLYPNRRVEYSSLPLINNVTKSLHNDYVPVWPPREHLRAYPLANICTQLFDIREGQYHPKTPGNIHPPDSTTATSLGPKMHVQQQSTSAIHQFRRCRPRSLQPGPPRPTIERRTRRHSHQLRRYEPQLPRTNTCPSTVPFNPESGPPVLDHPPPSLCRAGDCTS